MIDVWLIIAGLIKFGLYVCTFFTVGTIFYTKIFHNESLNIIAIDKIINVGAITGIVISLLSFMFTAPSLTGDMSGLYDIEILKILWSTPVRDALVLRLIGFCGIIIFLKYYGAKSWGLLISGCVVLASFTQIGHITNMDNMSIKMLMWFHLFGIALWFGILYPLHCGIKNPKYKKVTIEIAHSFGKSASVFVAILIIAGIMMLIILFGNPINLIGTNYGTAFIGKIVFVGLVLISALANKTILVPALKQHKPWAEKIFYWSLNIEILLLFAVLIATTILTSGIGLPG